MQQFIGFFFWKNTFNHSSIYICISVTCFNIFLILFIKFIKISNFKKNNYRYQTDQFYKLSINTYNIIRDMRKEGVGESFS